MEERSKRKLLREKGDQVIFQGCSIRGVVTDGCCSSCGGPLVFAEDYVAHCCLLCNRWLEEPCGNPECDTCLLRPAVPLPPIGSRPDEEKV